MLRGYLQFGIPIISFIIGAVSQVICCRYLPSFGLLKSEYSGFVAGVASLIISEWLLFPANLLLMVNFFSLFLVNLAIFASLSFIYFTFLNLGETGRRIRILRELYDADKGLSLQEILVRYNSQEILEKRLNKLVENGQVIFKNGRYYTGASLILIMAKFIENMKLLVLKKKSEFE